MYKKMKMKNGGKVKSTEEGKSLRAKITKAKLSGKIKDTIELDPRKAKKKKKY